MGFRASSCEPLLKLLIIAGSLSIKDPIQSRYDPLIRSFVHGSWRLRDLVASAQELLSLESLQGLRKRHATPASPTALK